MRIWAGLLLACAMFVSLPARADDDSTIPPNAPPDIVRILKKANGGQQPTPEETKRLMEWLAMVQSRQGAPGAPIGPDGQPASQPEGIPARFTFDINYTWTYEKGKGHGSGHLSEYGTGLVFAVDGGNANFDENLANPKAEVAQFRLQPNVDGGGTYSCQDQIEAASTRRFGRLSTAALIVVLESTGGGTLWPHGSSMGGEYEGTSLYKNRGDSSTTHDKDELEHLGCEFHDSPFAYEAHFENMQQSNPTKTPEPRMGLSYSAFSKAVRGGGTATISGTESYDESDKDETWKVTTAVSITIRPKKLQLVIEPDDRGAYEKWIPAPDPDESGAPELFGKPPLFQIHAAIHDPAKGPIVEAAGRTRADADRGGRIDFYLSGVSTNKGIAMNFPPFGKGDDKPDLFFPEKKQPNGIHWVDETHVYTDSEDAVEAIAVIASRDTAAYGKVSAECSSLGLASKSWESDDTFFVMPRDKNANHIADPWEKDEHIFEKNLPPEWDDEDKPGGLQMNGDVVTLFEQYRGFLALDPGTGAEKLVRIPADGTRTVFYIPVGADRDLFRQGIDEYREITKLRVLEVASKDRLAPTDDADVPRWINFNQTAFSSSHACAIWIEDRDQSTDDPIVQWTQGNTYDAQGRNAGTVNGMTDPGFTKSTQADATATFMPTDNNQWLGRRTPGTTQRINVSRAAIDGDLAQAWPKQIQLHLADFQRITKSYGTNTEALDAILADPGKRHTLTNEMIVQTAMHEFGHATGAVHHLPYDGGGDIHCPMRYWVHGRFEDLVRYMLQKWTLTTAPDGQPWHFCATDWATMTAKP